MLHDLGHLMIAHLPHRPNHRTESSKLHRSRKMDYFVWTLTISGRRMTRGEIRKYSIREVAANKALDCEVSVVESKCRHKQLLLIREAVTGKVHPLVLA